MTSRIVRSASLFATSVFLVSGLAPAQNAPPPPQLPPGAPSPTLGVARPAEPTGPVGKLELSQKEWNFGEVWQGEPTTVEITVKNVGEGPLTIEVKSSCGCTVPTRPKSPLAPGESDVMKISYNTAKRKGNASQNVTIVTNDPGSRSVAFPVKGVVKPIYEMKPPDGLQFGALLSDATETRTVEITNKYSDKMNLKLKEATSGVFSLELKEVEPGMRWELTATTRPPLADGKTRPEVILLTDNPKVAEIKIPCNATVQPPVAMRPNKLFLPKNSTAELKRSVYIAFRTDKPVKIVDVKRTPESIRVEVPNDPAPDKAQKQQMSYELKVTLPPGSEIPEGVKPSLEILTDSQDPKYRKFTLPIQVIEQNRGPTLAKPGEGGPVAPGPASLAPGRPPVQPGAGATPGGAPTGVQPGSLNPADATKKEDAPKQDSPAKP
jgi:hypothetical protein